MASLSQIKMKCDVKISYVGYIGVRDTSLQLKILSPKRRVRTRVIYMYDINLNTKAVYHAFVTSLF